jgi:hypothetical protein
MSLSHSTEVNVWPEADRNHGGYGIVLALVCVVALALVLASTKIKASQVNVAQNNIDAAVAYSDKGSADRTKIASVKTLRPVSGADGLERVDDQPLMATGLDLNGPPKRFSAKEMLENLETPGF